MIIIEFKYLKNITSQLFNKYKTMYTMRHLLKYKR